MKNILQIIVVFVVAGFGIWWRFGNKALEFPNNSGNTSTGTVSGLGDNQGGVGILPLKSGVHGHVFLGPVCPVQKNPPDLNCADKPYATTIEIFAVGSFLNSPFAIAESGEEGDYVIFLPPGNYDVHPKGGKVFPRCGSQAITIGPDETKNIDIFCDTGIR